MSKTIEIVIDQSGEVTIDAIGFKGSACAKATEALEKALGVVSKRVRKPEFTQTVTTVANQRVGS